MEKEIAIQVNNVSKTFRIPHEKITSLRGAFVNLPAMLRIAMQAGAFKMKENGIFRGIIDEIATLDKFSVFAIVNSAKTTRSDPFGHGGF